MVATLGWIQGYLVGFWSVGRWIVGSLDDEVAYAFSAGSWPAVHGLVGVVRCRGCAGCCTREEMERQEVGVLLLLQAWPGHCPIR